MRNKLIIVYHDDLDGRAAAAVLCRFGEWADRMFMKAVSNYADFDPAIMIDSGATVYIVDLSFPRKTMIRTIERARSVVWIDHHRSSIPVAEKLKDHLTAHIDPSHAACVVAWNLVFDDEPPMALQWIEDRDLWKMELDGTLEFYYGSKVHDTRPVSGFWTYCLCAPRNGEFLGRVRKEGKLVYRAYKDMWKDMAKEVYEQKWKGLPCLFVNAPRVMGGSEVFDACNPESKEVLVRYQHGKNGFEVSLYSDPSGPNVREIAEEYGGGGHDHAAGFTCEELPWMQKD